MTKTLLNAFLDFKASKKDLIATYGEDLCNVDVEPVIISSSHIILAIDKFITHEIDVETLLDWVNVVWFTELYEYAPKEENAIASVMALLETLDEGVDFTDDEYAQMIKCLETNTECEL